MSTTNATPTPFPYDFEIPKGSPQAGKTPRALVEDVLARVSTAYNALNEAAHSPDGDLTFEQVAEELHNAMYALEDVAPAMREALQIATAIVTFANQPQPGLEG